MYKPLYQQLQAPLGYLASADDQATSEWGNPQLQPMIEQREETYRMPIPRWAPGEFDEWKQAHVNHMPTTYGWNAQMRFNARKNPALAGLLALKPRL